MHPAIRDNTGRFTVAIRSAWFLVFACLSATFTPTGVARAQGSANVADQVTVIPLPPNTHFERHVVGDREATSGATDDRVAYSNTLGAVAVAMWAGQLVADA